MVLEKPAWAPEHTGKSHVTEDCAEMPEPPPFPRKTWDSRHLDVKFLRCATVAELVYAQDLGSCGETREGSSPSGRMTASGWTVRGFGF